MKGEKKLSIRRMFRCLGTDGFFSLKRTFNLGI